MDPKKNKCSTTAHARSVLFFPGTMMYHLRRYTPALAMQVGIEKNRIISPKKTFYTYYFSSKRPHNVAQPEKNMGELLKHHTYEKTIHCFFKFN